MDVETVREIIAAVEGLGGDAKEAFVWYLLLAYLPPYVLGFSFFGLAVYVSRELFRVWRCFVAGERLREAYGEPICWDERSLSSACDKLRSNA